MSIRNIAPYLCEFISGGKIAVLDMIEPKIKDSISNSSLIINHCNNLLAISNKIYKAKRIKLNEQEVIIITLVCYFHDIGLCLTEDPEIRRNHAKYSSIYISNNGFAFEKEIPLLSKEAINIIAQICEYHNDEDQLYNMPDEIILNHLIVKQRLIAILFALAESVDLGYNKTIKYTSLFHDKIFIYINNFIPSVEIDENIIVMLSRDLIDQNIYDLISSPVQEYIKNRLDKANVLLSNNHYKNFELLLQITKTVANKPMGNKTLNNTLAIADEIEKKTSKRKEEINNKLIKPGVIKEGKIDNELVILKRWSSFTPRMPRWENNNVQNSKPVGGGYFIIYNKQGVVIDPGYDFLSNLWNQKIDGLNFEIEDINKVIISHAHDDHCSDIEPIISLLYKKNRISNVKQNLSLYCSEGTHIKYERLFNNNDSIIVKDLIPIEKNINSIIVKEDNVSPPYILNIEYIKNRHNEHPWLMNYTGVAIKLTLVYDTQLFKIGYTSDTQFFTELTDFFKDVDILMMHFGNLGPIHSSSLRYDKNHLGLSGCHDLISSLKNLQPKLFLIGEFGQEEIGDDRIKLCTILEQLTGIKNDKKAVLPMDIGMRIKLPSLEIYCQEHDHFVHYYDIRPHLPISRDSIEYYCTN